MVDFAHVADQMPLFEIDPPWRDEWKGMPEFVQENKEPAQRIVMNFATLADAKRFGELLGQRVTSATDTLWFPKAKDYIAPKNFVYTDES